MNKKKKYKRAGQKHEESKLYLDENRQFYTRHVIRARGYTHTCIHVSFQKGVSKVACIQQ